MSLTITTIICRSSAPSLYLLWVEPRKARSGSHYTDVAVTSDLADAAICNNEAATPAHFRRKCIIDLSGAIQLLYSVTMTPTNEQYIQAFNSKVRRKQFEQFSVLLCDLHTSNSQQKKLLQTVLFAEEHSPVNWLDYINYVNVLFPTRKLQLFRLVNKAIECIDEDKYRNNKQYLLLHLAVIRFKQDSADGLKYFENVIWKRKVGVRFAQLYTSWAELASSVNCEIEDILLILERGISYRAEPLHTLITRIQNLKQQLTNPIMESEVGISSNSHETQFLFSKKRYQTDFDVESASAKPPNHESKRSRCDDDSVTCSLDTKCCSATNISAVDEYITHTSEVVGATVIAPVLQVEENLESENAQQPTPSASVDYITVGKRQFIKLGILGQGGSSTGLLFLWLHSFSCGIFL